jgi:hypothetical protein
MLEVPRPTHELIPLLAQLLDLLAQQLVAAEQLSNVWAH